MGEINMKTAIKQILGYVILLLIIASVIWYMMYKYNEKIKTEQTYNNSINNLPVVEACI